MVLKCIGHFCVVCVFGFAYECVCFVANAVVCIPMIWVVSFACFDVRSSASSNVVSDYVMHPRWVGGPDCDYFVRDAIITHRK